MGKYLSGKLSRCEIVQWDVVEWEIVGWEIVGWESVGWENVGEPWTQIKSIASPMKKKSLIPAGLKRKERIVKILFYESEIFLLNLNFFISALPVFESFVLYFHQKILLIHKLHDGVLNISSTMES